MIKVKKPFAFLKADKSWTFGELGRSDITYLTHSYHRYPAKFIPQLARRLIEKYSDEGELLCDPFMGGGTTLVEGLITGRRSIGVDITPMAYLVSKAKVTPIDPQVLDNTIHKVFFKINSASRHRKKNASNEVQRFPSYEKIQYWFNRKTIKDLSLILSVIDDVVDKDVRLFLRCGFSHVLKNCSKWKMLSIKPTRDKTKKIPKAIPTFQHHVKQMIRKNLEFYQALSKDIRENISKYAQVVLGDCRKIPCRSRRASLIVTSPPYVTSHDYLRAHQLSMFWLYPRIEFNKIRKNLIGYKYLKAHDGEEITSDIGNRIVEELNENGNNGLARSVYAYFVEMKQSLGEFRRILKQDGIACIVIGNTTLGKVNVLNAEVLTEMAINQGFTPKRVVKREIPTYGKFLPSGRDLQTGSFVSLRKIRKKLAYPQEFILVLES